MEDDAAELNDDSLWSKRSSLYKKDLNELSTRLRFLFILFSSCIIFLVLTETQTPLKQRLVDPCKMDARHIDRLTLQSA